MGVFTAPIVCGVHKMTNTARHTHIAMSLSTVMSLLPQTRCLSSFQGWPVRGSLVSQSLQVAGKYNEEREVATVGSSRRNCSCSKRRREIREVSPTFNSCHNYILFANFSPCCLYFGERLRWNPQRNRLLLHLLPRDYFSCHNHGVPGLAELSDHTFSSWNYDSKILNRFNIVVCPNHLLSWYGGRGGNNNLSNKISQHNCSG